MYEIIIRQIAFGADGGPANLQGGIKLPIPNETLDKTMMCMRVKYPYIAHSYSFRLDELNSLITGPQPIDKLNSLAAVLTGLSEYERVKLEGAVILTNCGSIDDCVKLMYNLDSFELAPDIGDHEALGRYFAANDFADSLAKCPADMIEYFDYGLLGRMEELDIAGKLLPEPEAEEIRALLTERSKDADIHRAVTFFKIIRYSYASKGTSFGCKAFDLYKTFSLIWAANRRLRHTVIENQSFERLICHYDKPDAFFYCDPPYFETEDYYQDVGFTRGDHIKLRNALRNVKGRWLLSYNDCRHIRFLYRGYHIEAVERLDNMAQRYNGGKVYKELLISNYDTTERKNHLPEQTSLFAFSGGISLSKSGWGAASLPGLKNKKWSA